MRAGQHRAMTNGKTGQRCGGDQFHGARGNEGNAQHAHGALTQFLGRRGKPLGFRMLLIEQHQHGQAAHAIQKAPRKPLQ